MAAECGVLIAMLFGSEACAPKPVVHRPPIERGVGQRVVRLPPPVPLEREATRHPVPAPTAKASVCEQVPERIERTDNVIVVFRDFDANAQCFGAYENGALVVRDGAVFRGVASTGMRAQSARSYETPLTDARSGPERIVWGAAHYFSKKWRAPMPNALFFNEKEGLAVHGGVVSRPRASKGCVRLEYAMARRVYLWYRERERRGESVGVIVTTNAQAFASAWRAPEVATK